MRLKMKWLSAAAAVICVGLLGWLGIAWAIPSSITISGALKNASGAPLEGTFIAEVRFYKTKTDTAEISIFPTEVTSRAGVFALSLLPPKAVMEQSEVWYSLAVDTDKNGLDASDLFPDRFQITSVPFALHAKPSKFFITHGGNRSVGGKCVGGYEYARRLFITPFDTPAGGVEFNRMGLLVGLSNDFAPFSLGLYDESGKMVVESPIIAPIGSETTYPIPMEYGEIMYITPGERIVDIPVSGRLEPSAKYFSAWGFDNLGIDLSCISVRDASIPALPDIGYMDAVTTGGRTPESFDPGKIISDFRNAPPISITLRWVDETIYN